jgi:KUP system potassium uptake protein
MTSEPDKSPEADPPSVTVSPSSGVAPYHDPETAHGPGAHHPEANPQGRRLRILTLTALGVVYGDIGTSPLYTIKECFGGTLGIRPTPQNVYGILSLILWSLILVVAVKYLVFILRADNRGEGGVLAMLALLLQTTRRASDVNLKRVLIILGLFGTALLYGDGVITPAISVLGAMEGLQVAAPALRHFVVVFTVVVLFVLFMFQKKGTARVGKTFGPITLIWFITIATLGITEIATEPEILKAVNPMYAVRFFTIQGFIGFAVLGGVFLAVTGAEALYADIGHFGKKPIRLAFFSLVLPALVLNYFGQGALLLRSPEAIQNPFYLLAPSWFLYPLLVIATLAAIVASQALISGAFSLAQQSIQLGYTPRLTIVHTSEQEYGQIFVPEINKALMVGTLLIVLGFRSTSALGAAYGIAVTGTMSITTLLFAVVARTRWNWPMWKAVGLAAFFFTFDFAFLGANALKIQHGGWVPLVIAVLVLTLMLTWKQGRFILTEKMRSALPLELLLADIGRTHLPRVPGTAVFLTSDASGAPGVLLHHLKHNKALHKQVILLSVNAAQVPFVDESERIKVKQLEHGFFRVVGTYGFMEQPNVPELIHLAQEHGIVAAPAETSYYLGRERLIPLRKAGAKMAKWRKSLFAFMSRNAVSATEYFQIPPNRVVELGAQIEF